MRQGPDLTGQRFGKLFVTSKSADFYVDKKGYKHAKWDCLCECGNTLSVVTSSLVQGLTVSCGCSRIRDLKGQKFSMLTVLELDKNERKTKSRSAKWICQCDCGKIVSVFGQSLISGLQKSCGCFNRSSASKFNYVDLTGKKFGRLTVIERMPKTLTSGGHQVIKYRCKCECGAESIVDAGSLRDGTTTSCGCWNRERSSKLFLTDFTNQKLDMITVIKRVDDYVKPSGDRVPQWLCQCECGNQVILTSERIKRAVFLSCGCVSYSSGERAIAEELSSNHIMFEKEYSFKDLVGPHGGMLKFDFKISGKNEEMILIEYQGVQHYKEVPHLSSLQRDLTDSLKRDYCEKHRLTLYEISYLDDIHKEMQKIIETHITC